MIDQCIFEVFKRDKRVILPDFGAIIYSDFNDEVNFNGFLDFDDGKVVKEIQKQQFLFDEQAANLLGAYIKDAKKTLDGGKSVFCGGIGYLFRDGSGAISIQKTKPSSASRSRNVDALLEDVVSSLRESSDKTVDSSFPGDDDETVLFGLEDRQTNADLFDAHENDDYQQVRDAETEEPSYSWDEADSDEAVITEEEEGEEYEHQYDEEPDDTGAKKKNVFKVVMLVAIPIVLLAAGGYYYFNYYQGESKDDKNMILAEFEPANTTDAVQEAENSVQEAENSVQEVENSVQEVAETIPDEQPDTAEPESQAGFRDTGGTVIEDGKTYSLILGSFKVESNADNYQRQLQSQGIRAIKFIGRKDYYFVGYEKIEGKSEAVKLLREVKEENPAAWIINKKLLMP